MQTQSTRWSCFKQGRVYIDHSEVDNDLEAVITGLNTSSRTISITSSSLVLKRNYLHSLSDLPNEMVLEIFSYVLDDYYSLLLTSKSLKASVRTALRLIRGVSFPEELFSFCSWKARKACFLEVSRCIYLCRSAFQLGGKLRLAKPISNNIFLFEIAARFAYFLESPGLNRLIRSGKGLLPKFLLEAWTEHRLEALPVIEACLRVDLLTRNELFGFPGLIKGALLHAMATNCAIIVDIILDQIEVISSAILVPWSMLGHLLKLAILEGTERSGCVLIKRFKAYSLRDQNNRVPDADYLFTLTMFSVQRNRFILAQELLKSGLLVKHSQAIRFLLFEAIRCAPIHLFHLQKLHLGLIASRRGLAVELARWNRLDLLKFMKEHRYLDDALLTNADYNVLHAAAENGAFESLEYLLREIDWDWGQLASAVDASRFLPIHLAVLKGNKRVVSLLLDNCRVRCCIDSVTKDSPLHLAVGEAHFELVKTFLKRYPAWLWLIGERGESLLHRALRFKKMDVFGFLLQEMINTDRGRLKSILKARDDNGRTPLQLTDKPEVNKLLQEAWKMVKFTVDFRIRFDRSYLADL